MCVYMFDHIDLDLINLHVIEGIKLIVNCTD